jgi:hypothetical protein
MSEISDRAPLCELCHKRRGRIKWRGWMVKAQPPFLVSARLCARCRHAYVNDLALAAAILINQIVDAHLALAINGIALREIEQIEAGPDETEGQIHADTS